MLTPNFAASQQERSLINHINDYFLPPINMAMMEKIFSALVLADTFPKPTLVRLVQVKYKAEM